jgi:hypothetical protein
MSSRCLVFSLGVALILPAAVRAQFAYNPGSAYNYGQTQGAAWAPGAGAGFGYYPWGPFSGVGYGNSMGGFLNGSASVISASGQYEIDHQQANLSREQVKSAHIDNKRKMFDELRYEKENTPPLSANLNADREEQVRQALANPQLTDIWQGNTLNTLLTDIQYIQSRTGLQGATVPLAPDVVKNLSLSTGTTAVGSIGMLKDGGKLKWPPELQDPRFTEDMDSINKLLPDMIQSAQGDGVTGLQTRQMESLINGLEAKITAAVDDMTPSDNIRAMSYAQQLSKTTKMLRDPNVAKQLSGGAWQAQGNTVHELVGFMTSKGLKFAPATVAEKPYYTSLQQSMATYDNSLRQLATSPGLRQ